MSRLKKRGYSVHFFYLWVPSVELALQRIRERVSRVGHDVPEHIVQRRFARSLNNFFVHYRPLADSWVLYDNTWATPRIIAAKERSGLRIIETRLYNELNETFGKP